MRISNFFNFHKRQELNKESIPKESHSSYPEDSNNYVSLVDIRQPSKTWTLLGYW